MADGTNPIQPKTRETRQIAGRILGPGDTISEVVLLSPHKDILKVGEFVYYEARVSPSSAPRKIICRITSCQSIQNFPDYMFTNPDIPPSELSRLLGFDEAHELYRVEAAVLGYFDHHMKSFVNPRLAPDQGQPVFLVPSEELKSVISSKVEEPGSAHVGHLFYRPEGEVPVYLDVAELVSKHLAVLAATGSGKSYTVGVILEEIMGKFNKGSILVIDPHGEYDTLRYMKTPAYADKLLDPAEGYVPEVKVITQADFKVRISDLSFSDWQHVLKGASDKMMNILKDVINSLQHDGNVGRHYTLDDIIHKLNRSHGESQIDESSVRGLEWRLKEYGRKEIFSDSEHLPLKEIFAPGQVTVLQLPEVREEDQQLITSIILQRILKARVGTLKNKFAHDHEFFIDFPVFIVLEEAHRFSPAFGESRSKHILKTILSEGRKFGIGTCLVSQRPGKLDSDTLSQCLSQVIMKIINPTDQDNIKQSVEGVTGDMLKELPSLTKGQAIIVGEAVNTPVLVKIRKRYTKHGGESRNAPQEWLAKMSPRELEAKKREEAPRVVENKQRKLFR
jgi:uncharacterized protein